MQQSDISKVRSSIHQRCGNKVMIQLDRGRNKVDVQEGVIQKAYASVFTILVNDENEANPPQLLSLQLHRRDYKRYQNEIMLNEHKALLFRIRCDRYSEQEGFFWY